MRRIRWYRRRIRGRPSGKKRASLLIVLVIVLTHGFLFRLRPSLADYAENEIQYRATKGMEQAVSNAMQEQSQAVSNLYTLESGTASALVMNASAAEQIRTKAVQNTYEALNELEQRKLSVAIGTLIDPQYLAGIGPKLPFSAVGLGVASSSVQSEFIASGINQTKYSLVLHVSAEVQLHALWCSRTVVVANDYPLTETVIVGEVPAALVQ